MSYRHGTTTSYVNKRCRCILCVTFWRAYTRAARARRNDELTPDDPRHGMQSTYVDYACRCQACTAAHAARERRAYRTRSAR